MFYDKMIKLYRIEFMQYNNCCYDAVSTSEKDYDIISLSEPKHPIIKESDIEYYKRFGIKSMDHDTISLSEPKYLIIKESDIEYYKRFGNGIKSMEFVGYMEDREVNGNN